MTTSIRTICKVGTDGNVVVPVGKEEAGTEVEVTVSPRRVTPPAKQMTQEEYAAFINSIAGSWVGEFPEIDDPPPEERDPL